MSLFHVPTRIVSYIVISVLVDHKAIGKVRNGTYSGMTKGTSVRRRRLVEDVFCIPLDNFIRELTTPKNHYFFLFKAIGNTEGCIIET